MTVAFHDSAECSFFVYLTGSVGLASELIESESLADDFSNHDVEALVLVQREMESWRSPLAKYSAIFGEPV